jgi:hypothetical protein
VFFDELVGFEHALLDFRRGDETQPICSRDKAVRNVLVPVSVDSSLEQTNDDVPDEFNNRGSDLPLEPAVESIHARTYWEVGGLQDCRIKCRPVLAHRLIELGSIRGPRCFAAYSAVAEHTRAVTERC